MTIRPRRRELVARAFNDTDLSGPIKQTPDAKRRVQVYAAEMSEEQNWGRDGLIDILQMLGIEKRVT